MISCQHRHMKHPLCNLLWQGAKVLLVLVPLLWGNESSARADLDFGLRQDVVHQNDNEIPQWKDIGLEDLLAVDSQPTVPTCRVTRPVQSLNCGGSRELSFCWSTVPLCDGSVQESVAVPGCYIYFLLNLRL